MPESFFRSRSEWTWCARSAGWFGLVALTTFLACSTSDSAGPGSKEPPSNDGGAPSGDGGTRPGDLFDGGAPEMKASVSQFGITWTFDRPHLVGQFVNGDFWVVGPVTLRTVSPAPSAGRNGSVVDPAIRKGQGYDDRGLDYDPAPRATFPLTLSPVSSLVSSISHGNGQCPLGSGGQGYLTYNGVCQGGPVKTQAVLTVVAAPPPAGAFRPPYAGSAFKPFYSAANIDWARLPKLPKPASAPTDVEALRHVERPWIDHMLTWTLQHACATENMFCYGREIGDVVSDVAQYVLLDTPVQKTLAVRLAQLGIDNYGIVKNGDSWGGDGGHMNGRKFPIVFAGTLLNDAGMKRPGVLSGEDVQTYRGTDGKAHWGAPCTACYLANGCAYSGSCTNGSKDCRDPAGKIDGCIDYRNCCTSLVWPGQALAALALHAKADWNHDPFFDYVDRWMSGDVVGGGDTSSAFVKDMWTKYRNNLP
ncbi:hypothetical protein [Pendulispora albinea]|uniref:Uncharacterized protein n=1 Tax=Pendulispora albinea TaxID=2741071 RepID=A0ABZ2M215_9BACT